MFAATQPAFHGSLRFGSKGRPSARAAYPCSRGAQCAVEVEKELSRSPSGGRCQICLTAHLPRVFSCSDGLAGACSPSAPPAIFDRKATAYRSGPEPTPGAADSRVSELASSNHTDHLPALNSCVSFSLTLSMRRMVSRSHHSGQSHMSNRVGVTLAGSLPPSGAAVLPLRCRCGVRGEHERELNRKTSCGGVAGLSGSQEPGETRGMEDDARRDRLWAEEIEGACRGALREKALARAQQERVADQHELVREAVREQH